MPLPLHASPRGAAPRPARRRLLAGACLCLATLPAAAAADVPAAWPEPDARTHRVDWSAFQVAHEKQQALPAHPERVLEPCDVLTLAPGATGRRVRFTFARGGHETLSDETPRLQVPCEAVTLSAQAVAFLRSLWLDPARERRVATLTKGTATPPLELPEFQAPASFLGAGARALHLRWTGGVAPFSVALRQADTGALLLSRTGLVGDRADLPPVTLAPGRYQLSVKGAEPDARGQLGAEEDQLMVVDPRDVPPPPPALATARVTEAEREFLYARYLDSLEDGRWTFEAMQHAHRAAATLPEARRWLAEFGR